MSDSKESPTGGSNKNVRRNLPSWMNSIANESKPHGKKPISGVEGETNGGKRLEQSKECDEPCSGSTSSKTSENNRKSLPSSLGASNFSKLLEGVVFALSGFVNPERSILRSQALEMGAEYQPDWNSNCTLLICAFPNTPKFRQVEANCGTIVSKEWIAESYSQKKLVDIDSYLMHAGKPWRRQKDSVETSQDLQSSVPQKSQKQIDSGSHEKSTTSAATKSGVSTPGKFSPSRVKKWATDDLNKTISWLESQEEKPEASEIKKIAVEGILTCLQDAIDLLKENQDIQQIIEQWHFIPLAVEELAKLDGAGNSKALLSKEELCREAMTCKEIYEIELRSLEEDLGEKKRPRRNNAKKGDSDYDSDETIEMTEEEIDLAYSTVASKLINVE